MPGNAGNVGKTMSAATIKDENARSNSGREGTPKSTSGRVLPVKSEGQQRTVNPQTTVRITDTRKGKISEPIAKKMLVVL